MVPLPLIHQPIACGARPANDTTRTHDALAWSTPAAPPRGVRRVSMALEMVVQRGHEHVATWRLLEGTRATMGREAGVLVAADTIETTLGEVDHGEFVVHVPAGARARTHRRAAPAELAGPGERIVLDLGDRAVLALPASVQVHARVVAVEHHVPLERVRAERRSARRTLIAAAVYLVVLVATVAIGRPAASAHALDGTAQASARAVAMLGAGE